MSVEVTEADRAVWEALYDDTDIDGGHEDGVLALIAAHRRQAEEAMRERCAKVAEHRLSVCEGLAWQARFAVFEALPAAIRGMEVE